MKKNPVVIAIIVLLIVLVAIIVIYLMPEKESTKEDSSSESSTYASIQTIENTLSSSGQISSALDEKVTLHASYYFSELLVDKEIYIKEGTNIIKYTNGTYLTAPYDCVLTSYNLPK